MRSKVRRSSFILFDNIEPTPFASLKSVHIGNGITAPESEAQVRTRS